MRAERELPVCRFQSGRRSFLGSHLIGPVVAKVSPGAIWVGKENGRFPYAVGFTGSATCLLKLGGKGTRLEIKVRRLGVRTGFLTQEGLDGYIWGNFRQFSVVSNVRRRFTLVQFAKSRFVPSVWYTSAP